MARGTILGLVDEVAGQPRALEEFMRTEVPRAARGSVFVGAGDSYAAALVGFYASKGMCIALDPYSLASSPEIARGLDVSLISVSGRTASNLMAARRVRRVAKSITAVTADEGSPLARAADEVVRLPMTYSPRTSGMLSFSLSSLAVLKILGVEGHCDFGKALKDAKGNRGRLQWGKGTTYFLGNSLAYPAALYAAAKTYELLGSRAHAELLEEFSHLELFSLARTDAVNVFSCFDPSGLAGKLKGALTAGGYEARTVPGRGATDVERLFHCVFVVQLSVLDRALKSGLSKPVFLAGGERLGVSDAMIY